MKINKGMRGTWTLRVLALIACISWMLPLQLNAQLMENNGLDKKFLGHTLGDSASLYITLKDVNVRKAPSTKSSKVGIVRKGVRLVAVGRAKGTKWIGIKKNGKEFGFIYGTFFTKVIADNEIVGTLLWSRGITITALIVAFLSPLMGAIADKGGYRKLYLIFWTWVSIAGSLLLWFPIEGQVIFALTAFIIGNVGFEMGGVFCNAFLPEIAPKEKIGRVSGYGWSFGYVGGLIALALGLLLFINPEIPIFNLDKSTHEHIRGTNIMVAIWFAVFSIPTFLFVNEDHRSGKKKTNLISDSIKPPRRS